MDFHIRTNLNNKIGIGHLSRSLRLANKIVENGHNCNIYVDNFKNNFFYQNKKINFFSLYKKENYNSEKKDSLLFIRETQSKPGIVIIDDYRLTQIWEKEIYKFHKKIIVLEDLNINKHYADIIINFSPNFLDGSKYNYKLSKKKNCRFLLGPKYSLINREYKKQNSKKFNIVFYNGGSGDLNFLKK